MRKSLVQGLNEKDMQAVINTYNLNPYYYPTLFPLGFTPTLTWKALTADTGIPVMADVVSYDASSPRKTREVVSRASGDIPKIMIGRDKEESAINEYNALLHYAKDGGDAAKAILDWIYDDTEFVWKGVNARLEWLALRAASTGKIELSKQNNAGVVTEIAVDFLVPAAQKTGVTVAITEANKATSKPITMLRNIKKAAKAKGAIVKFAFTDQDTLDNILVSAETIAKVAPWILKATQIDATPNLESLNKYLAAESLPTFIIIEQQLTFESSDGTRTVLTPWETGVICFSEDKVLGKTWYGPLADETVKSDALKVKRGHVLIKRFAVEEPLKECTIGMANAFPAIGNVSRKFMVDTLHTYFLTN